jgi:predicted nucleic acid-binding protein
VAILVDSSVWIASANPKNKECIKLKRLIKADEPIYLIDPIQAEICQGAKSPEQFHALWASLLGFHFLEVTKLHWGKSAWNYFRCRKQGLTLTTLDCLIGTIAGEYKLPLWTLDKTLLKSKKIIGFESYT